MSTQLGHDVAGNKLTEGHTSTKVIHQPGGASSFSLSHDDGPDDRFGPPKAKATPAQQ